MVIAHTWFKKGVLVAFILRAGADEELRAHALYLLHFTLAVVVVVQDHAVQGAIRVVAHGFKGDIVVFPPPARKR